MRDTVGKIYLEDGGLGHSKVNRVSLGWATGKVNRVCLGWADSKLHLQAASQGKILF